MKAKVVGPAETAAQGTKKTTQNLENIVDSQARRVRELH
jgi:hypothetical protein